LLSRDEILMSSPIQPADEPATGTGTVARRHPIQLVATIFGVVFLLVGILGFVPGVTTNYDQLTFAGPMSGAMLLGLFAVSILHNIVHLAFGIAGLLLARTVTGARNYLIVGGVVYAVIWIYGLITDPMSSANFVPLNTADNWLHLILAVAMVGLGVLLGRNVARHRATAA
jgi:arginine exporter protein ArgO